MVDTSNQRIFYTITVIDLPEIEVFVEDGGKYVVNSTPNYVSCFASADETIQFLSDKELFGYEVRSWDLNREWNMYGEMRITLFRTGGQIQ